MGRRLPYSGAMTMTPAPATMTSMRPYLVRSLLAWINDNQLTPYALVDATVEGTQVPPQAVNNGKIVLNLSAQATNSLVVADDHIQFSARFSGRVAQVWLPMAAIQAVFANETGLGMGMPPETGVAATPEKPAPSTPEPSKAERRSHLSVVK